MLTASAPTYALFGIAADSSAPLPYHVERVSDRRELHNGTVEAHSHPHIHQLTFWIEGGGEYHVNDNRRPVSRHDLCWIPAGTVHGFAVSRKSDAIVLSISRAFFDQQLAGTGAGHGNRVLATAGVVTCDRASTELLRVLFARAEHEYAGKDRSAGDAVAALARLVVIEIGRHLLCDDETNSNQLLKSPLFEAIKNLADECFRAHPSVATFSRDLGSTPYLVNRACMQATGQAISTYLRGRVLQEAERLMMFTTLDIATIGALVGYADPSHFSRAFRASRGKTPRDWRQECTTG